MNTQILKLLFEYIDARIEKQAPGGDHAILRRMQAEDALLSICPEPRDP